MSGRLSEKAFARNKTMMRRGIVQNVKKKAKVIHSKMPIKTLAMFHKWNELSDDSEDLEVECPKVFDIEEKCRKCDKPRALCNIHRR
jgi:hypothetical protein